MILITKIEYCQTDRDAYEIYHSDLYEKSEPLFSCNSVSPRTPVSDSVVREVVRGRRFVRPDGLEVMVGMTEQAADVLGLQYEAWQELEDRANENWALYHNHKRVLEATKKAGFFTRLKWLFMGYRAPLTAKSKE